MSAKNTRKHRGGDTSRRIGDSVRRSVTGVSLSVGEGVSVIVVSVSDSVSVGLGTSISKSVR